MDFKVSIIIPVYCVSDYIEECLHSALDQTYGNIEYVIVDDVSPDNSISLAKALVKRKEKEQHVKFITHQKNRGLSAARNTGIRHATGDYLYFLDSDDKLLPHSIEALVECAVKDNADVIVGNFKLIDTSENINIPRNDKSISQLSENNILLSFLQQKWVEMAWNKLTKKSVFENEECFFCEGILHEDNLWSFMLAANIKSMTICHKATYLYRIRPQSITQQKTEKNTDDVIFIANRIIDFSNNRNYFELYKPLSDYIINICYYAYKTMLLKSDDIDFVRRKRTAIKDLLKRIPPHSKQNSSLKSKLKVISLSISPSILKRFFKLK